MDSPGFSNFCSLLWLAVFMWVVSCQDNGGMEEGGGGGGAIELS